MNWFRVPTVLLLAVFSTSLANAQSDDELWDRCNNLDERHSWDLAIGACGSIIRSGTHDDENLAIAYYNRGRAYLAEESYKSALSDFDQAIRLLSDRAIFYVGRGFIYRFEGQLERAIADFDEAVRLEPRNTYAFAYRGATYRIRGETDLAISDFDEAIRLDPGNAEAFAERGLSYWRKGGLDQAVEDLSEAIALDPDNATFLIYRGMAFQENGHQDKAIADFDLALSFDPDNAYAIFQRGNSYRLTGDFHQAISDFDRSIELQTTDAEKANWSSYAGWRFAKGKFRDTRLVLQYAKQAARLAPHDPDMQDVLADALSIDGQQQVALDAYERLMRTNTEYVSTYQTFLKKHGYYEGHVDGQYGPSTRAALNARIATGCALLDDECE